MKKIGALVFILAFSSVPALASAEKLTAGDWKKITDQRKQYFIFAERESFGERGAVFSKTPADYLGFMDDEAARAPDDRDAGDLFLSALTKNDPEAARTLSDTPARQHEIEETAPPMVPYAVPIDWIAVESEQPGSDVYQTSFDKKGRLFVVIRMVSTGGVDAEDWVREEVSNNAARGIETIGEPSDYDAGDKRWVKLEWRDPAGGDRGRRYYLEGPNGHLIEVSVFAKEETFGEADLSRFDAFLASFEA